MKRTISILLLVSILTFCLSACNSKKYDTAFKLINNEDYTAAYEIFCELDDYKNSKDELKNFHYVPTKIVAKTENSEEDVGDITFSYNEQNLPSRVIINSDGKNAIYDFTYDEKGNLIKQVYIDYKGNRSTHDLMYDDSNNCIKEILIDYKGNKTIADRTYNDKGNLIKQVTTHSTENDTITFYNDFIYDDNNNLIRQDSTNSNEGNSNISYTEYTYDEKGNLIKKVWYSMGSMIEINDYTYDEQGNLVKEVHTIHEDEDIYDYIYDDNDNLIKKTVTSSDGEKGVLDITYTFIYTKFDFSFEIFLKSILNF